MRIKWIAGGLLLSAQVCLALTGYAPEHLEAKYGTPVEVDRSAIDQKSNGVDLGVIGCTYSNRTVAGFEVQPLASFERQGDGWYCKVISYKLIDPGDKITHAQAMELLEDIRQGYWRLLDVPHIARDIQVGRYECVVTLKNGFTGKYVRKVVATAVQTKAPKRIAVSLVY